MFLKKSARYQGRPLPRPAEPVYDQGLQFDMATLVSRRRALQVFGLGAGALGLVACGAAGSSDAESSTTSGASQVPGAEEIPDETAGPFPGNGSNGPDVLGEDGVVRADIRSSFGTSTTTAQGVPMTLELTIADLANGASGFAGAAVYVWHCDREGRYSLYSSGAESENYLRGVQIADAGGKVTFTSVFPACYPGRWPHIHFEVYPDRASITDAANTIATSQVALPRDVCETVYATAGYQQSMRNLGRLSLASDNVFGDDSAALQLASVAGDVPGGYTVSLAAGVDTRT